MVDEGRGTPSAASPLCPATSLPTTREPSSWRGQRGHLSFIDQQAVTSSGPLILFIGQTDSTGSRLSVLLLELSCPSGSVQNSLQDPCSLSRSIPLVPWGHSWVGQSHSRRVVLQGQTWHAVKCLPLQAWRGILRLWAVADPRQDCEAVSACSLVPPLGGFSL